MPNSQGGPNFSFPTSGIFDQNTDESIENESILLGRIQHACNRLRIGARELFEDIAQGGYHDNSRCIAYYSIPESDGVSSVALASRVDFMIMTQPMPDAPKQLHIIGNACNRTFDGRDSVQTDEIVVEDFLAVKHTNFVYITPEDIEAASRDELGAPVLFLRDDEIGAMMPGSSIAFECLMSDDGITPLPLRRREDLHDQLDILSCAESYLEVAKSFEPELVKVVKRN